MSRNDVTGDRLVTSASSDSYRAGWDTIFGKKKLKQQLFFLKYLEAGTEFGFAPAGYLGFRSEEEAVEYADSQSKFGMYQFVTIGWRESIHAAPNAPGDWVKMAEIE